jgi:enolase
MITIENLTALEVLDSRGYPTIRVFATLSDGSKGSATVPSGASTGQHEAVELRDGEKRYGGKGVQNAVKNVEGEILAAVRGMEASNQVALDERLIALDGTPTKSRLGANAILGVSMAVAVATAHSQNVPLYQYLGGEKARRIPVPMMNVLNGGKHADNSVDFQEFMIMPIGAPSFREGLRYCSETFHALKSLLHTRGYATSVGDEGGFAPNLKSNDEACELLVEAMVKAGYVPGVDLAIALDPAASSFFRDGMYHLDKSGTGILSSDDMTALFASWIEKYPIVSLEDGLDENDWAGFKKQTAEFGNKVQIVGDDLYVTNTQFIQKGIEQKSTNSVLIKLNQIGTVTETVRAIEMCRDAGWSYVVSHRSGETEDTFLADFAVAMGGGQVKTGSCSRSERVAKYNRLLEIENDMGSEATFTWR